MVFRTNVQSAYGAGRYKAIRNPVVTRTRPYVQYRTVGDSRVRDEHAALDGKTYASDDPVWQRIAPPNGFNCRCSMVTLSRVDAVGVEISTDIPLDYVPTPGFDQPPTPELDIAAVAESESGAGGQGS
jgi:SPP1 gp7 family putative phage head morphogenesis protein